MFQTSTDVLRARRRTCDSGQLSDECCRPSFGFADTLFISASAGTNSYVACCSYPPWDSTSQIRQPDDRATAVRERWLAALLSPAKVMSGQRTSGPGLQPGRTCSLRTHYLCRNQWPSLKALWLNLPNDSISIRRNGSHRSSPAQLRTSIPRCHRKNFSC